MRSLETQCTAARISSSCVITSVEVDFVSCDMLQTTNTNETESMCGRSIRCAQTARAHAVERGKTTNARASSRECPTQSRAGHRRRRHGHPQLPGNLGHFPRFPRMAHGHPPTDPDPGSKSLDGNIKAAGYSFGTLSEHSIFCNQVCWRRAKAVAAKSIETALLVTSVAAPPVCCCGSWPPSADSVIAHVSERLDCSYERLGGVSVVSDSGVKTGDVVSTAAPRLPLVSLQSEQLELQVKLSSAMLCCISLTALPRLVMLSVFMATDAVRLMTLPVFALTEVLRLATASELVPTVALRLATLSVLVATTLLRHVMLPVFVATAATRPATMPVLAMTEVLRLAISAVLAPTLSVLAKTDVLRLAMSAVLALTVPPRVAMLSVLAVIPAVLLETVLLTASRSLCKATFASSVSHLVAHFEYLLNQ
ncbi:MAG: hypothetical protein MHM6MM_000217 [Cercozoa sp. M6MM]